MHSAFPIHHEALAMMDFAQEHDLRVLRARLVWHSQTPVWFSHQGPAAHR